MTPPLAKRIVRMAELEIDPLQLPVYTVLLREEIEASLASEPGVLALHATALRGQPSVIRILEIYASEDAYEAHLKSPHFLKYKTGTAGMVKSLKLIETDPVILKSRALR